MISIFTADSRTVIVGPRAVIDLQNNPVRGAMGLVVTYPEAEIVIACGNMVFLSHCTSALENALASGNPSVDFRPFATYTGSESLPIEEEFDTVIAPIEDMAAQDVIAESAKAIEHNRIMKEAISHEIAWQERGRVDIGKLEAALDWVP